MGNAIGLVALLLKIQELAEKTEDGIKPFSSAEELPFDPPSNYNPEEEEPDPVYYDDEHPYEDGGCAVIAQYLLAGHHDIISVYNSGYDIFADFDLDIRVRFTYDENDNPEPYISITSDDNKSIEILIHDGMVYYDVIEQ